MAIGRINATLTGVQPGGLAKIVPTSVAVGSGSGSVDSNGNVTFSGVSSVSLNGCFSSTYTNYKIVFNFTSQSASSVTNMRMRASGTDLSTSTYKWGHYINDFTTTTGGDGTTSSTFITFAYSATANARGNIEIWNPFTADNTMSVHHCTHTVGHFSGGGFVNNTTSYDGFTMFPASGTITGNIRVYGYNQ